MVEESARLRTRARECISSSNVVIEMSRRLLSQWPANSATPVLPHIFVEDSGPPARQPAGTEDGAAAAALERIADRSFTEETVQLDGRHFVDCRVANCVLEYSGGPVILEGTEFTGCRFRFGGEAAMTISLIGCFGLIEDGQLQPTSVPAVSAGTAKIN